ncbi:MAG TPA: type II CAAX prenyl endopeptidase Rce1 family protein, partial [Xenococcaceae cyanobacterium]
VWRGFVYRQCQIVKPGLLAIFTSGLFFTLHHIIALFFYLQNSLLATLSSIGVLIAGIIWSACYQKSGFWTCYISHILADLAIGLVGWHLLFV